MLVIIYNQSVQFSLAYDYRLSSINLPLHWSVLFNDIAGGESRVNFLCKTAGFELDFHRGFFGRFAIGALEVELWRFLTIFHQLDNSLTLKDQGLLSVEKHLNKPDACSSPLY